MASGVCSIEGCELPVRARGWCKKHWQRWSKTGDPLGIRPRWSPLRPESRIPLAERFWAKVDKNGPVPVHAPELGPCWVWTAFKNSRGYGRISAEGRQSNTPPLSAPTVSLQLAGVEVPGGMFACHHCDNPPCVNPTHLYVGTRQQNHDDMVRRGREARGFALPQTKLSDEQVREIRALHASGVTQKELAARFGISASHMSAIVNGKARRAG